MSPAHPIIVSRNAVVAVVRNRARACVATATAGRMMSAAAATGRVMSATTAATTGRMMSTTTATRGRMMSAASTTTVTTTRMSAAMPAARTRYFRRVHGREGDRRHCQHNQQYKFHSLASPFVSMRFAGAGDQRKSATIER
jgi:hypothetical protein